MCKNFGWKWSDCNYKKPDQHHPLWTKGDWWRSCSKCYAMDCFGTCFTHVQTCDDVRVQSATEWTASVHTLHMSKPVMTFVFKVLRNGLLRYMLYTCPNPWWRSCSKCYGMDCFGAYFTHVLTCDDVRVQSATEWTGSVHTLHMSKPVMTFVFKVLRKGRCPNLWWRSCSKCYAMDCFGTYSTASVHTLHMSNPVLMFVFKVLRNGLLRHILCTCSNLWWRSCSKGYGMDCFGTYFTHVQTCDDVRVQSATQWTASVHTLHMFKPVMTFVFKGLRNGLFRYILYTCPNLWWRSCSKCYAVTLLLRYILYTCSNLWWRSCSMCYGMDCWGTYFTHVQTCADVRVQSATQWTASVHTLHMSKPVTAFVFKVLRNGLLRCILYACLNLWWRSCSKCYGNGLLRYIPYTCPNLWWRSCSKCYAVTLLLRYILYTCPNLWWRSCSKCYGMDGFGTYFTHVQTCDDVGVQSATEWTAEVHTLHMSKPVMMFVFTVLRNGLLRYILYTCPNLWWRSCSKCYGMDCFGTYFTHVQTCDDVRVQSAMAWTASEPHYSGSRSPTAWLGCKSSPRVTGQIAWPGRPHGFLSWSLLLA